MKYADNVMNTTVAADKGPLRAVDTDVDQVMVAFRTTYADAIIPNMTEAQWQEAARIRRLMWQSPHRLSLADAVHCYGQMTGNYNEFRPRLLRKLNDAFPDDGITVTPAREMSVAVYLHVPDTGDLRSRVEQFAQERFHADVVEWSEPGTLRCWWD